MTTSLTGPDRDQTGHPPAPDRRRWLALGVLALVQFMLVLDVTVVNVALGSIQRDLGFSRAGLTWVVDGYVLTAGSLLLLGGRLADLLGRRRMFLVGTGLFALASLTSGLAQDPAMLVTSRFVQGAGEAIAAPAAFGLIALLFTAPAERAKAIGVFGGVAGLGGTFGPIVSGVLLSVSWRWIFFVNLPIAIFAMVAVVRLVDESRASRPDAVDGVRPARPDLTGAALVTAALGGVVYGLIQAADHSWGSTRVLAPLLAGLALAVVFVAWEARTREPLVPLRFFANRTRVTANLTTVAFSAAFFTMFFLTTLYFETVLRWSPITTGLAYLPFGLGIGVAIGVASGLMPRIGVRPVIVAGFLLFGAGIGLLSRIGTVGHYPTQVLPALLLMAFGSGCCFAGFGVASLHEVSGEDASLASGVQSAVQQIGGAIGLAVLATLALRHTADRLAAGVPGPTAQVDGYTLAFRLGALVMALGAVLVLVLMERVRPEQPEVDPTITLAPPS